MRLLTVVLIALCVPVDAASDNRSNQAGDANASGNEHAKTDGSASRLWRISISQSGTMRTQSKYSVNSKLWPNRWNEKENRTIDRSL